MTDEIELTPNALALQAEVRILTRELELAWRALARELQDIVLKDLAPRGGG